MNPEAAYDRAIAANSGFYRIPSAEGSARAGMTKLPFWHLSNALENSRIVFVKCLKRRCLSRISPGKRDLPLRAISTKPAIFFKAVEALVI
jgi:hypothetical protein